ncbi:MAG: hypothetical protein MJA30_17500 [Cytophagales bacterium]|nr:hypothetical protein [Cytophagales bacterium]
MAKSDKNEKKKDKPTVNPDLEGFNIEIDSFGEIKTTYNIDDINDFLNKNVEDKKLEERDDYDELKSGKKKQNPKEGEE